MTARQDRRRRKRAGRKNALPFRMPPARRLLPDLCHKYPVARAFNAKRTHVTVAKFAEFCIKGAKVEA